MSTEGEIDLNAVEAILDAFEEARRAAAPGPHCGAPSDGGKIRSDDLIPILQEIQKAYGYLPGRALERVSRRTGIPTARIYGVVTFYNQFYTKPHGKHSVRCCRGTACHVRGGRKMIDAVRKTLGIEDGETSDDMQFSLETVACLGACALGPVMVVDSAYYGKMTPRRAEDMLNGIMKEKRS